MRVLPLGVRGQLKKFLGEGVEIIPEDPVGKNLAMILFAIATLINDPMGELAKIDQSFIAQDRSWRYVFHYCASGDRGRLDEGGVLEDSVSESCQDFLDRYLETGSFE
jgi:hypothetical protein